MSETDLSVSLSIEHHTRCENQPEAESEVPTLERHSPTCSAPAMNVAGMAHVDARDFLRGH